jgi:pilus assembly protein Flp/PilA
MLSGLLRTMHPPLKSVFADQDGQAIVEYALILFLVALVVIAILGTMGAAVSSMFSTVVSEF